MGEERYGEERDRERVEIDIIIRTLYRISAPFIPGNPVRKWPPKIYTPAQIPIPIGPFSTSSWAR